MVATQAGPENIVNFGNGAAAEPHALRWTTEQFYQMYHLGWFENKRVELIEGEIVEMTPMLGPHATTVTIAGDALRIAFGAGYFVRIQMPLHLSANSEPEPDIAVIAGVPSDYRNGHPANAALVVEVSDSTLAYDRRRKTGLYARAGIKEYWILNLVDNQLEVYRQPTVMPKQLAGYGYAETTIFQGSESLTPLAAPHVSVAVFNLLPRYAE